MHRISLSLFSRRSCPFTGTASSGPSRVCMWASWNCVARWNRSGCWCLRGCPVYSATHGFGTTRTWPGNVTWPGDICQSLDRLCWRSSGYCSIFTTLSGKQPSKKIYYFKWSAQTSAVSIQMFGLQQTVILDCFWTSLLTYYARFVDCVFTVWQRGVDVASESCLHCSQWRCSESVGRWGREHDGEQQYGGIRQVSESSSHTSPDEAQHPPLQGKHYFPATSYLPETPEILCQTIMKRNNLLNWFSLSALCCFISTSSWSSGRIFCFSSVFE